MLGENHIRILFQRFHGFTTYMLDSVVKMINLYTLNFFDLIIQDSTLSHLSEMPEVFTDHLRHISIRINNNSRFEEYQHRPRHPHSTLCPLLPNDRQQLNEYIRLVHNLLNNYRGTLYNWQRGNSSGAGEAPNLQPVTVFQVARIWELCLPKKLVHLQIFTFRSGRIIIVMYYRRISFWELFTLL